MVRTFAAKSSPRFLGLSIVHVLSLMAVQLDIPIESQRSYFIYPSEIGSFALGSPLSDGNLFSLCQEHGNPSGFLKFFVSHSPNGPARQQGSASVKLCIPVSEEYLSPGLQTYLPFSSADIEDIKPVISSNGLVDILQPAHFLYLTIHYHAYYLSFSHTPISCTIKLMLYFSDRQKGSHRISADVYPMFLIS